MDESRAIKGRIAELQAMLHFTQKGYEVYLPQQDNGKYDMLVVKDAAVYRVSVKYTASQHSSGSWRVTMNNVSIRKTSGNVISKFNSDNYDYVAVYIAPEDRLVVVPANKATPYILTIPREG